MDSILWGDEISLSSCVKKLTPFGSIGFHILEGDGGIRFVNGVENTLITNVFLRDQGDSIPWGTE